MTKTRPEVPTTARFNVSDTARLLKISSTSVYRYKKLGMLKPMANEYFGRFVFTGQSIMSFWTKFYK